MSRSRPGLTEALLDAGFMAGSPPPTNWYALLASTVVCNEATPLFAEPVDLDRIYDLLENGEQT